MPETKNQALVVAGECHPQRKLRNTYVETSELQ